MATSNRLIFYRPGMLGKVNFTDYQWEDVKDVVIKEGMMAGDLTVTLTSGKVDKMGGLDKSQMRRFYSISQQKEQEWREKRRFRELEEARAKSGGVQIGNMPGSAPVQSEDPVQKLAKAKAMLDQQLISEAEYEALKAKIISAF